MRAALEEWSMNIMEDRGEIYQCYNRVYEQVLSQLNPMKDEIKDLLQRWWIEGL